jgi:hypothetical protein
MGRDFYSYGVYFQQYQYWREKLPQNQVTYLVAGMLHFNCFVILCIAYCVLVHSCLLEGGIAGALSWTSCYPVDVVKSRIQSDTEGKYKNFFDCVKKSYHEEGIKVCFLLFEVYLT